MTGRKFSSFFFLSAVAAIAVGCSSGGGSDAPAAGGGNPIPNPDSAAVADNLPASDGRSEKNDNPPTKFANVPVVDARTSLVNQVSNLEKELRDYGISFEVTQKRIGPPYSSYSYSYRDNVEQTQIGVALKDTRPSEDELKMIGKTMEDRDRLLVQMNDLWQIVKANDFDKNKEDASIMTAVMKVQIVRARYTLPKFIDAFSDALQKSLDMDGFNFIKDETFKVSLWNEVASKMTNAQAIALIDGKLEANKKFEDLKVTFLRDHIAKLEETVRLEAADTDKFMEMIRRRERENRGEKIEDNSPTKQIETLKKMEKFELFDNASFLRMKELRDSLQMLAPEQKFDASKLVEANREILTEKRTQLILALNNSVKDAMAALEMEFTTTNGKVTIDEKSKALSKVRGIYKGKPMSASRVENLKADYMEFVKVYGNRSRPLTVESDILKKADLFGSL